VQRARIAIWHKLGSNIWAVAPISPTLVNTARMLLGREIAFFHGKIILKEVQVGGTWEWHQDGTIRDFFYPQMLLPLSRSIPQLERTVAYLFLGDLIDLDDSTTLKWEHSLALKRTKLLS
jgi:hypothetical protein